MVIPQGASEALLSLYLRAGAPPGRIRTPVTLKRSGSRADRRADPPFVVEAVVLGAVAASRFLALACEPGEIDEAIFAGAVTRFDLFDLSPQAPGFPVWILIGRLLLPLCVTPFNALATASTVLSAVALGALYTWGKRLVGGWAALAGTVFAAALPVVWVNGGRAFSDTPATALFLVALACLTIADERRSPNQTRWREMIAARRARLLGLGAGLATAAGAGIRPHLVLAFGPVLLLGAVRLWGRAHRRDAAFSFVGASVAGTLASLAWLFAQAGGVPGLFASLAERVEFRAHAFATGTFGTLVDSFLVRDLLSSRRAAVFWALVILGVVSLAKRGARGVLDLGLVLVPLFFSLWFLHSRAMSRYSVPFAMVASLVFGVGLVTLLKKGPLGLLAGAGAAALFAREAYPVVRWGAEHETPPIAAIRALERYVHPGRETIVADDDFHAFLRTERWEGRLVAWGYTDEEIASAPRQANRRYVRLADFTIEPDAPDRTDSVWKSWYRGGRVLEALSNRRLLAVAVRDPAPPLFGPGFGPKERVPRGSAFRWAGTAAHLIVPGLQGPPAALLSGERPGDAGPTALTVRDAATGKILLTRRVDPGAFEVAIVGRPVYGPLERAAEYVLSCDRPKALPPLAGAVRPREGCFTFREAAFPVAPDKLWERRESRYVVDIGSPKDRSADPEGFWGRERLEKLSIDMRWTTASASVLWCPVPRFAPKRLVLRARPPGKTPVDVTVTVDGQVAGKLFVLPGDFAERALDLPEAAADALAGMEPVRIGFSSAAVSPKDAGTGSDPRALGIAVDLISLE
jgi:hypothetical protein